MKIEASFRPTRASGTRSKTRDLGDEMLAYDRDQGQVHVLNRTAREIYSMCDGTRTAEEMAEAIALEYDVDAETSLSDLLSTLERLIQLGLVDGA